MGPRAPGDDVGGGNPGCVLRLDHHSAPRCLAIDDLLSLGLLHAVLRVEQGEEGEMEAIIREDPVPKLVEGAHLKRPFADVSADGEVLKSMAMGCSEMAKVR